MKSSSLVRTAFALLVVLFTGFVHAHAAVLVIPAMTPEIDPSLAVGGLTLLVGTVAMVRGRRKQ